MATIVTGDQAVRIGNKCAEIQRQLYLQQNGYPYDPEKLDAFLQRAVEGKFDDGKAITQYVVGVKTHDTDLGAWLEKAEAFAKKHFDVSVKLAETFQIPEMVPWEWVLPVFIPAGVDNRKAVELLKKLGLNPSEETDVMQYSGSAASEKHQLFLIANSERPDKDTMGLSPNTLRKTKKLFLVLKGYGLAMGLHNEDTKGHLDSEETFTWFPEERLSDVEVARGYWYPRLRKVKFDRDDPGYVGDNGGARMAISVPLKT